MTATKDTTLIPETAKPATTHLNLHTDRETELVCVYPKCVTAGHCLGHRAGNFTPAEQLR